MDNHLHAPQIRIIVLSLGLLGRLGLLWLRLLASMSFHRSSVTAGSMNCSLTSIEGAAHLLLRCGVRQGVQLSRMFWTHP